MFRVLMSFIENKGLKEPMKINIFLPAKDIYI